jgi:hypothetical protein
MTTALVIAALVIFFIFGILVMATVRSGAEASRDQWDEPTDNMPVFGATGNVVQLSAIEVQNLRMQHGLDRLMRDVRAGQYQDGDEGIGFCSQPEDAYSKKLRLNAEHEAELAVGRHRTPEQLVAAAESSDKYYWANREAILQRKKQQRIAAAIAAGKKPRVHATYLRQDDNPHPVHSPEYQQFAKEKRQRFHEQKHAVHALTPAPERWPVPYAMPAQTSYTYGQRALA